jgi:hypothetical protein
VHGDVCDFVGKLEMAVFTLSNVESRWENGINLEIGAELVDILGPSRSALEHPQQSS